MRDIINKLNEIEAPVNFDKLASDIEQAIINACDNNNQPYNTAWVMDISGKIVDQLSSGEGTDPDYGM
jgi:hypothetical protein